MKTRKHLAAEKNRLQTHNCAQAVLCTYCDLCGLDPMPPQLLSLAVKVPLFQFRLLLRLRLPAILCPAASIRQGSASDSRQHISRKRQCDIGWKTISYKDNEDFSDSYPKTAEDLPKLAILP